MADARSLQGPGALEGPEAHGELSQQCVRVLPADAHDYTGLFTTEPQLPRTRREKSTRAETQKQGSCSVCETPDIPGILRKQMYPMVPSNWKPGGWLWGLGRLLYRGATVSEQPLPKRTEVKEGRLFPLPYCAPMRLERLFETPALSLIKHKGMGGKGVSVGCRGAVW